MYHESEKIELVISLICIILNLILFYKYFEFVYLQRLINSAICVQ